MGGELCGSLQLQVLSSFLAVYISGDNIGYFSIAA